MIGTLSIIAQVGSFITAEYASLRVFDRILARMGDTDDSNLTSASSPLNLVSSILAQRSSLNVEIPPTPSFSITEDEQQAKQKPSKPQGTVFLSRRGTMSSWLQEMSDTAFVLYAVTPRSLVLLDELGRSTSEAEGIGIAWAVCEESALIGQRTRAGQSQTRKTQSQPLVENDTILSSTPQSSSSAGTQSSSTATPLSTSLPSSTPLPPIPSIPFSELTNAPSSTTHICDPIVLLTTHFPELFQLETLHPNILNVHLNASKLSTTTPSSPFSQLRFSYSLEYGPADMLDCGIDV